MEKLLDVENVSISFIQYTKGLNLRDLKVITDLTLDISEGEILAVLGSSGSGKSLLAHAIFGILPENANLNGKIKWLLGWAVIMKSPMKMILVFKWDSGC